MIYIWFCILPLLGLIIGWTVRWVYAKFQLSSSEQKAERIKQDAVKEAEALMAAVDEAVPYHVAGSEHAVSGGISFWFCPESADPAQFDTLAEVTDSAEYLAFYDSISEQWDAPDWVYEEIAAPSVIRPEDYAVDYELGYNEDGLPQIVITNGFDSLIRINPVLHIPQEEADRGKGCRGAFRVHDKIHAEHQDDRHRDDRGGRVDVFLQLCLILLF